VGWQLRKVNDKSFPEISTSEHRSNKVIKMKTLDEDIRDFGNLFMNRLDNEILQFAIDYIDYDERGLAFETICDHLSEYYVPVTQEEYNAAIKLCEKLQMDINDISIKHLNTLIIDKEK